MQSSEDIRDEITRLNTCAGRAASYVRAGYAHGDLQIKLQGAHFGNGSASLQKHLQAALVDIGGDLITRALELLKSETSQRVEALSERLKQASAPKPAGYDPDDPRGLPPSVRALRKSHTRLMEKDEYDRRLQRNSDEDRAKLADHHEALAEGEHPDDGGDPSQETDEDVEEGADA